MAHVDFLITGVAVGGPRNGVKLSASSAWNGVVRKNVKDASSPDSGEPYPGRYVFDIRLNSWVWDDTKSPK